LRFCVFAREKFYFSMFRDTQIIQDFFNSQARRHGDSVKSLAWESEFTQRIRFFVLADIAPLNKMRILDVGCGKADMHTFFDKEGVPVEYYGVDCSPEMVKLARKIHPGIRIFYRDFLNDAYYPEIDYAFASGIANVLTPNNSEYMETLIKKMFALAKKGAAVNMLSSYAPGSKKNTGMYFYSPEYMLAFALKLTPKVGLRHDYLLNDFTLYLYKEE